MDTSLELEDTRMDTSLDPEGKDGNLPWTLRDAWRDILL
jgi:hypothetical protein